MSGFYGWEPETIVCGSRTKSLPGWDTRWRGATVSEMSEAAGPTQRIIYAPAYSVSSTRAQAFVRFAWNMRKHRVSFCGLSRGIPIQGWPCCGPSSSAYTQRLIQ
jgi:hypothetical protein